MSDLKNIGDLKPAAWNPRQISPEARKGLARSLAVFGDLSGVVYNAATGNLIAGHQRRECLKDFDASEIEWGDSYVVELGEPGKRFKSTERDGVLAVPGGARYRVREVRWEDGAFEAAANVAANSPLLAGDWTDELEGLLAGIEADMEELHKGLRLDDLADVIPVSQDSTPPDDFQSLDEGIATEHECPKCGYRWSGQA